MGLEVINEFRKSKGITIEELSSMSLIPLSTVKKICAGITTNPNLDTVIAIANALNCSIDDFKGARQSIPSESNSIIITSDEYPVMAKYRRLNDSGKEYIDAQLDFALSQEKYKAKTTLATEQAEVPDDVDDLVDVSFAAYGGESGTFQITHKEYDEVKELFDAYDYTKDK